MKYDFEIEIEPKTPLIAFNHRLDQKLVREFKSAAKQCGVPMTHVLTKMLKEFVNDYHQKSAQRVIPNCID